MSLTDEIKEIWVKFKKHHAVKGFYQVQGLYQVHITKAESPASHISTAVSLLSSFARKGWTLGYSILTYDAASAAWSALTNATQHPLKPAPLNRAPKTPGAFFNISYSCIKGSQPANGKQTASLTVKSFDLEYLPQYVEALQNRNLLYNNPYHIHNCVWNLALKLKLAFQNRPTFQMPMLWSLIYEFHLSDVESMETTLS